MTVSTFTIGALTIENNYPQIDIIENFYTSAKERQTLYTIVAISKGVYTFVGVNDWNAFHNEVFTNGTFASAQLAAEAAFDLAVKTATELEAAFNATADAANQLLHIDIAIEATEQDEANEVADAFIENSEFIYDSRRPYSHVQICELAGLPLQASEYIYTHCSGDHEAGSPLGVAVTDSCEFGYPHHTYLGFVCNWRNCGLYTAALATENEPMRLGSFKTTLEAQAALLRLVCDTVEAWAAAANACLATELPLTPENADTELEYEALSAGRAFDAPTGIFNKQYEVPTGISDIDALIDEIAADEYEDLQSIDGEIAALQARLLSLGSIRQDIVEEYAWWNGKCKQAKEAIEYSESYEANDADADLRQSIWFSTGQDIM